MILYQYTMTIQYEKVPLFDIEGEDTVADVPAVNETHEVVGAVSELSRQPDQGVSVSLARRALILAELGEVYANYARAKGLTRAVTFPHRRQQLSGRYVQPTEVAAHAMQNAKDRLKIEQTLVEELIKSDELVAAGFDPVDVETAALQTTIEIRHGIGVAVGAKNRQAAMKKHSSSSTSHV